MDYPVSKKIMAEFFTRLDSKPRSPEQLKAIIGKMAGDLCSMLSDADVNVFTDEVHMMMQTAIRGNPPGDILPHVVFGVLDVLKQQGRLIDYSAADDLIDLDSFGCRERGISASELKSLLEQYLEGRVDSDRSTQKAKKNSPGTK